MWYKPHRKNAINELLKLFNQGHLSAALEQAQTLTQQYPDAFIVWNILGASAAQIGHLDKAINAFKRVLTIKPDYVDAYNNLGNVLKAQGQLEGSIAAYKRAYSDRTQLR